MRQTPAGTVGPLERGFSEITNSTDFEGWVLGFYGEQSRALAGVASMIADAQTAKENKKNREVLGMGRPHSRPGNWLLIQRC